MFFVCMETFTIWIIIDVACGARIKCSKVHCITSHLAFKATTEAAAGDANPRGFAKRDEILMKTSSVTVSKPVEIIFLEPKTKKYKRDN